MDLKLLSCGWRRNFYNNWTSSRTVQLNQHHKVTYSLPAACFSCLLRAVMRTIRLATTITKCKTISAIISQSISIVSYFIEKFVLIVVLTKRVHLFLKELDSNHFAARAIKNMIEHDPLHRIPLTEVKEMFHPIIPRSSLGSSSNT